MLISLFLVTFCAWASIAPIDGGAVAPGIVSPDGNKKTVQHLEGGIIAKLNVRDGDTVADPGAHHGLAAQHAVDAGRAGQNQPGTGKAREPDQIDLKAVTRIVPGDMAGQHAGIGRIPHIRNTSAWL